MHINQRMDEIKCCFFSYTLFIYWIDLLYAVPVLGSISLYGDDQNPDGKNSTIVRRLVTSLHHVYERTCFVYKAIRQHCSPQGHALSREDTPCINTLNGRRHIGETLLSTTSEQDTG